MKVGKALLEIIWGSEHKTSTYSAPKIPDDNALLRGLRKFADPIARSGEAVSRFFNFGAATAGEIR